MTPNILRSFAGGLIVATSLLSVVYFSGSHDGSSLSEKEMKSQLEDKGYVIHTEKEWKKLQGTDKKEKETADAKEPAKSETPPEKTPEETADNTTTEPEQETPPAVTKTSLNIENGMTGYEVGLILEEAKLIDNAWNFVTMVEGRGVANYLRPGVYEVDNSMTVDQIINMIFRP